MVEMDASIGVAEWRKGKTAEQLIEEADAEMYRDKKHSRGLQPRQQRA
jgi:PleD family two-component response regulator